MKKSLMTFCTVVLLATQVPTADAAVNKDTMEKAQSTDLLQKAIMQKVDFNWFEYLKQSDLNITIKDKESIKQLIDQLIQLDKEEPSKPPVEQDKEEPSKPPVEQDKEEPSKPPVEQDKEEPSKPPVEQDKEEIEKPEVQPPVRPTPPTEQAPSTDDNQSNVGQSDVDQIEAAVVELTNKERAKAGLAPLQMDSRLMAAAREKSQDMKNNNYFSHTSPTFGSPFDRLNALGISYSAAAENIAKGQRTAEEVVAAWMASQGHRENILNPNFTHIGVGYVKEGNIWTQQFIKK
ncbi:CAP domain-containing protein [Solibacillus sp. CAU 1738]|uniref:CAP domain-containing protein n=1 Tax=Solibacillus sp. CAU 1738 TaxID=3140363 RepID=UPI00326123BC